MFVSTGNVEGDGVRKISAFQVPSPTVAVDDCREIREVSLESLLDEITWKRSVKRKVERREGESVKGVCLFHLYFTCFSSLNACTFSPDFVVDRSL